MTSAAVQNPGYRAGLLQFRGEGWSVFLLYYIKNNI